MTSNFQGYTTHQDHPHLPCIDAFDPQTRPLLSGMRMPVFLNWSPCIWYSCAPYSRGTKRSHASAMLVLLLYPNSSLIDVILTQDRVTYPHMQYSLQVHLAPAKGPSPQYQSPVHTQTWGYTHKKETCKSPHTLHRHGRRGGNI